MQKQIQSEENQHAEQSLVIKQGVRNYGNIITLDLDRTTSGKVLLAAVTLSVLNKAEVTKHKTELYNDNIEAISIVNSESNFKGYIEVNGQIKSKLWQ